jgi:hypothetical protein
MTRRRLAGFFLTLLAVCLTDGVRADPRGTSTIVGHVWTAENDPITDASLRLRNILSGSTELTTVSNRTGEFSFGSVEAGSYFVEYVDGSGRVLALSNPFTVTEGETVSTFIRLGSRRPFGAGFFTSAAAAVLSSAAVTGITAVEPTGRPISPNR